MLENSIASWPPYQFFYIESMLTISQSAVNSYLLIQELDQTPIDNSINQYLDCWQNVIQQTAALSRYFWPTKNNRKGKEDENKIHQDRGTYLRKIFNMNDKNALKSRALRNSIEHFDERIDMYLQNSIAGNFIPNYVGPKIHDHKQINRYFRAFFTDTFVFEVLGKSFDVVPIIKEMSRVNNLLIKFSESGTFSVQ